MSFLNTEQPMSDSSVSCWMILRILSRGLWMSSSSQKVATLEWLSNVDNCSLELFEEGRDDCWDWQKSLASVQLRAGVTDDVKQILSWRDHPGEQSSMNDSNHGNLPLNCLTLIEQNVKEANLPESENGCCGCEKWKHGAEKNADDSLELHLLLLKLLCL